MPVFLLFLFVQSFASSFAQDLQPFHTDDYKYGFKDKDGQIVIQPQYTYASDFFNGLAIVNLERQSGAIDKKGKVVIPIKYNMVSPLREGRAAVTLNKKSGYVNINGKEVIPLQYDLAVNFDKGLAIVVLNKLQGYIDTTGKVIIAIKYENADYFFDGLARVRQSGKWGYINDKGKTIIPFLYDVALNFKDGFAEVTQGGEIFKINTAGIRAGALVKADGAGKNAATANSVIKTPPTDVKEVSKSLSKGSTKVNSPLNDKQELFVNQIKPIILSAQNRFKSLRLGKGEIDKYLDTVFESKIKIINAKRVFIIAKSSSFLVVDYGSDLDTKQSIELSASLSVDLLLVLNKDFEHSEKRTEEDDSYRDAETYSGKYSTKYKGHIIRLSSTSYSNSPGKNHVMVMFSYQD